MKTVLLFVMTVSCLVDGIASSTISSRLKRFVYFDSTLFEEVKKGSVAALISVIAHVVFLISFLIWFYFSIYGGSYVG
jgi:Flp pilus assembly protein protease CpaA